MKASKLMLHTLKDNFTANFYRHLCQCCHLNRQKSSNFPFQN